MVGVVCEPRDKKLVPVNEWQGRASLYYSVAEALVTGRLDGTSYRPDSPMRDTIRALAAKVEYEIDPSAKPGQFKGWVIVETTDGRRLEKIEPFNRGSAERPLSEADILKKFRDNGAALFPVERLAAIEQAVQGLAGPGAVRRLGAACVA
jgi:2-methylcitrate dehydratase PrpD